MDITQNLVQDIWENNSLEGFTIVESAESEVDGKYILAKVEGPAFFPETTSKNKVYYPLEAWENAISDPTFVQRLESRLVYGTIGHDCDLSDNDVRDGKVSHIVTKVWIDEHNTGHAEYLILNTPPGVILNTLLRAKSKIRVSTKAAGFFEPTGRDGSKSIIPSSFKLERIDFVIDPGYVNALPELIESFNKDTQINPIKETNMEKVVQILESRISELKDEKSISESTRQQLNQDLIAIKEANASSLAILENYKAIGTAAAIHEAYAELEQYRSIGTVQEIHEALDAGEETIDKLSDTVTNLKDELEDKPADTPAEYNELGTPAEVKDALDQAIEIADELQRYRDLGSVEELQEVIDNAGTMTEALENQEKEAMCAKFGVTPDVLGTLCDKGMTLVEAGELLAQIKGVAAPVEASVDDKDKVGDNPTDTPADAPAPTDTPAPADTPAPTSTDDEDEDKKEISESLSSRLMRQTARLTPKAVNESAPKPAAQLTSRAARLMTTRR